MSDTLNCCFSVKPKGYEVYIQMGHACNGMASIYIGKHTPTDHFVAIRQVSLEDCDIKLSDLQVTVSEYVKHIGLGCVTS